MRTAPLVPLILGLLPAAAAGADPPPPKEWQPVIDSAIVALKNKDAAALDKLLMSFVEAGNSCPSSAPPDVQAKDKADREQLDKDRSKRISRSLEDCNIMNWKAAKLIGASGGEPKSSKCEKFKPSKGISVVYDEGPLTWTIWLEPVVLNGKRLLLSPPSCHAGVKK